MRLTMLLEMSSTLEVLDSYQEVVMIYITLADLPKNLPKTSVQVQVKEQREMSFGRC